ncbi:MAG: HAD family hydrolase, partial [Bariatricus sp.]
MNNTTKDALTNVNYKLIALDLDGTLTNDEKEIPEYTARVLMRAQEQGVRIALVSGRPSPGLHYERDVLKLQEYGGLLLSYNGGRIVEAENGNVLYETTLDPQVTKEILRYLEDLPVTVIMDDCDRLYVKDRNGYQVQQESYNDHMDVVEVP